jgi:signal transduction histidine kinase
MLLRLCEDKLRNQAADVKQINTSLAEKESELENKNHISIIKNKKLDLTQVQLNSWANKIVQGSKFKYEFLATMFHEWRTTLKSILLFSELLKENNLRNLTGQQIDNLSVIDSSSPYLLNLNCLYFGCF